MLSTKKIPFRPASLALVALGAACLIAACGSSSSGSASAAAGTTSSSTVASASGSGASSFAAQRAKLAACMKQHGVTLPSRPAGSRPPGSGGSGTASGPRAGGRFFFGGGGAGGAARRLRSNPKMQAALKACGANFRFRRGRGFGGRISHQTINKYVTCVRQHGYDLPAPNFSGKGSVFPANIRTNKKFQAASKSCQSLLIPPRPQGSSSGGGTTGD